MIAKGLAAWERRAPYQPTTLHTQRVLINSNDLSVEQDFLHLWIEVSKVVSHQQWGSPSGLGLGLGLGVERVDRLAGWQVRVSYRFRVRVRVTQGRFLHGTVPTSV
jgi:hypothetical protein